ncbi:hypothetical protein HYX06_00870 [Candidatus Woesearchaeota archaeon]|nr:hypothetical protein [Candidatus Woesearchaeota archaeon]
MTETQGHSGHEHYVHQITELAKPGANYNLVRKDIEKASAGFTANYQAKPTPKGEREKEFNKVAATYVHSLFGIGYDDPSLAGNQVKQWLSRLPEGALGRIYGAIERGDKVAILNEINQAWQAQANKLESILAEVREQPDEVKLAVYGNLASMLGDVNGYKGSPVSVAENLPGAISGLQQRLAVAESVSKTQGAGHSVH